MRYLPCALLAMMAIAVTGEAAPTCRATSGALVRPLIELYTSEGCDSCPPAERWLSGRFDAGDSRAPAIALAFHVDYWDRLGWVDRFASAQFTARQYDAMRANGASFVYTPQILLQGHDYGSWRDADAKAIDDAARANAGATISLEATPGARNVVVHADAHVADRSAARLFVAYADSGLVSDIKAGENRGLRLVHDHVVRALRLAGTTSGDGRIDTTLTLPRPNEHGTHPTLVAFVAREATGDVLQALAVPLDACASP
jgi:hypothetical protein